MLDYFACSTGKYLKLDQSECLFASHDVRNAGAHGRLKYIMGAKIPRL